MDAPGPTVASWMTATTPSSRLRTSFLARRRAVLRRVTAQLLRGPLAMALAAAGLAAPARAVTRASTLDDERSVQHAQVVVHAAVVAVLDRINEEGAGTEALDVALLCAVAAQEAVAKAAAPAPASQDVEDVVAALQFAADAAA
jgi:hypothetical protein